MRTAQEIFDYICMMRKGERVKRFHTEYFHGEQNVSAHTFGVVTLCIALTEGQATTPLILGALHHDVDEQRTGDIPAHAKWACVELKDVLGKMERQFRKDHALDGLPEMTPEESVIASWADSLELYYTTIEQQLMGNQFMRPVRIRIYNHMMDLPQFPPAALLLQQLEKGGGYEAFCSQG